MTIKIYKFYFLSTCIVKTSPFLCTFNAGLGSRGSSGSESPPPISAPVALPFFFFFLLLSLSCPCLGHLNVINFATLFPITPGVHPRRGYHNQNFAYNFKHIKCVIIELKNLLSYQEYLVHSITNPFQRAPGIQVLKMDYISCDQLSHLKIL